MPCRDALIPYFQVEEVQRKKEEEEERKRQEEERKRRELEEKRRREEEVSGVVGMRKGGEDKGPNILEMGFTANLAQLAYLPPPTPPPHVCDSHPPM